MAFVRLNEAVLLESVLEVPVPVRFLFVLLGPSQSNVDYHEIGRSFSTLMSDKVDFQRKRSLISWLKYCLTKIRSIFFPDMASLFKHVILQSFHEVAYFADDRQDLLNGINEFLDYSIVIPPSDIEGKDLLKTVVEFQKQMLRKRKERELKKNHSFTGAEQNNKGCLSNSHTIQAVFCIFIK